MNKLTYSIKTVLRPDKIKADGTIPVYFALRVGPYPTRIPTGKSVELSNWNVKECCPKKTTKHGQLLAAYFNGKMSDWHTYMLQLETMGSLITLTIATNFFKGNTKVTLFSFWEEQLELWQNDKEENTLKSYRSALKMLKSFNSKLNFGDLT
ncbi:MAG: hypothetical protein EOO20_26780 [Chryseobacterium sp.]|nr:MAG: hypothetical protein EOO20_26780 [Chryseobacterium sp.]